MRRPIRHIPPRGPGKQSPKERALSAWHGLNLGPLEVARKSSSKKASDLLPKVWSGLRIEARRAEAEIVKVWNHSLPPDVVAHAQPAGLRGAKLLVHVDSSVWLADIVRFRRQEILTILSSSLGPNMVREIIFRLA